MRDEDDGHADLVAKLKQHIKDGRPGTGVDHGGRLVGEKDLRLEEEDAGDHQTLHLSAGKLEGIFVCQLGKLQVDEAAGFRHHLVLLFLRKVLPASHIDAVQQDGIDFIEGIEGREGILKDGLDAGPVFFQLGPGGNIPGFPLIIDLAVRFFQKAEQHLGQGCLSGTGFAYDTDEFPFMKVKVHVIHGFCCDLPGMEISGDAYAFQTGRGFGKITSG